MPATRATTEDALLRLARELAFEQQRTWHPQRLEGDGPGGAADPVRATGAGGMLEVRAAFAETQPADATALSLEQAGALAAVESVDVAGAQRLATLAARVGAAVRQAAAGDPPVAADGPELESMRTLADALTDHLVGIEEALRWVGGIRSAEPGPGARIADACTRTPARLATVEQALADYHGVEVAIASATMRARDDECHGGNRRSAGRLRVEDSLQRSDAGRGVRVLGGWRARPERPDGAIDSGRPHARAGGDELLGWLDTLVAAGLFMPAEAWIDAARAARYRLYRLIRETRADARMPDAYVPARASAVVDIAPATEDQSPVESFLTRYFTRKRLELFRQRPPVAAERLQRFQQVRETMLGECCGAGANA